MPEVSITTMFSLLLLAMDKNVNGYEVMHAFSSCGPLPFFLNRWRVLNGFPLSLF
jgi:hypothetical protein